MVATGLSHIPAVGALGNITSHGACHRATFNRASGKGARLAVVAYISCCRSHSEEGRSRVGAEEAVPQARLVGAELAQRGDGRDDPHLPPRPTNPPRRR